MTSCYGLMTTLIACPRSWNANASAGWENPRLGAPGRPDLLLRDVRATVESFTTHREKIFSSAAKCLAAAAEVEDAAGGPGFPEN